jgi:hypothetical protein
MVEHLYYDVNTNEWVMNGQAAQAQAPAAPQTWHSREPRHVHSLKWVDADGIEHMHVVRSDDLDDVLKQMATVKQCIKAARAKAAEAAAAQPPTPPPAPAAAAAPEAMERCPIHGELMRLHTGKDGRQWKSHRVAADGTWCKGKPKS